MYEITYNYQMNCLLQGPSRAKLLQKVTAASIAYAAPCPTGELSDCGGHYAALCRPIAYKVLSKVNEQILVNVDDVMRDVESLWRGRYELVNSPVYCTAFADFDASLTQLGTDVKQNYDYWITHYLEATKRYISKMGEVV